MLSESRVVEIVVCAGCVGKHYGNESQSLEGLLAEIEASLKMAAPDVLWSIKTYSCFRFCPDEKITLTVAGQLGMSRQATVEGVVREVLSLFHLK